MTALPLLLLAPLLMWIVQTVQLRHYGLPIRWRIDTSQAPRSLRTVGRVVTQASLLAIILCYPALRREPTLGYYADLLPWSRTALQGVQGAAMSILFLCTLYGVWIATDCLRVSIHQSRRRWMRRLLLLVPTACFGALVEELLFRGVVMGDLLSTPWIPRTLAVGLSVLVFAGAHYVRNVKRRWTMFGHLMLGLLLCLAYLETGNLWLPVGLHAGGIAVIMGTRPFFRYRGPAWITGASIFPFAGVAGLAGLGVLTAFVVSIYGR